MHNYKELDVWKKSLDLAEKIYHITAQFPSEEKFGLMSQMRRASVSLPSNIAEGAGRNTPVDFNNFLGYAYGSSCELDTQMILAQRVGLITQDQLNAIDKEVQHIQKMLYNLKKSLTKK